MKVYKFGTLVKEGDQTYLFVASPSIDKATVLAEHAASGVAIIFMESKPLEESKVNMKWTTKIRNKETFMYYSNFLPF